MDSLFSSMMICKYSYMTMIKERPKDPSQDTRKKYIDRI